MQTDILQHALLAAVQIALLALLPILLIVVGTRIINGLRDAWLPWTPYVELGAFAIGVAAGVIVFGKSTDPRLFGPSEVFRVGGFWDMNYIEFLGRNASVLLDLLGLALRHLVRTECHHPADQRNAAPGDPPPPTAGHPCSWTHPSHTHVGTSLAISRIGGRSSSVGLDASAPATAQRAQHSEWLRSRHSENNGALCGAGAAD